MPISHERARELRKEVFRAQFRRNPMYGPFLGAMHIGTLLPQVTAEKREILLSLYAAMRHIDDVVDGDSVPVLPVEDRELYVNTRVGLMLHRAESFSREDLLLQYTLECAASIELDLMPEIAMMLNSMLFDAKRVGQRMVFPRHELDRHFYRLDIEGTIRGTLKLVGEDPDTFPLIQPAGVASRIHYNLRDLGEDIIAGYINIPVEDMEKFGIQQPDLDLVVLGKNPESIRAWKRAEAERGLQLLQQYRENMRQQPIGRGAMRAISFLYNLPSAIDFHMTKLRN